MVKVSVKDISSCEKVITVDVPVDEIKQQYDIFYTEIGKVAKVPGFRPGKAPRDVLTIHYKDTAREEVIKKIIPKSLRQALEQKNINPITYPAIQHIDFDAEKMSKFVFDAHIELRPKIKLDKYDGIQIQAKSVEVKPSEVDELLKNLQESHARFVPLEGRSAQLGDFIACDYICKVDGKEIEKRSEDLIALKEKDYLEGFSTQLIGVNAGDEREVKVNFPSNYTNKDFAGKSGVFHVKVKELKTKKMPELSDEFAKEVGDFRTIDELKNKIRTQIELRKKDEQDYEIEKALLDELIKRSKFEIPKRMAQNRLEAIFEESLHRLRHQGMKEEVEMKERDGLKEKLKPEAERQIRISFIFDEIAEREKITAEPGDFELKFQQLADRHKRSVDEVKKYFEQTEGQKDTLTQQIINEKVLQRVRERAIIKVVS